MDDLLAAGADTFDHARFREVMGYFCTGVAVVTAMDGAAPVGFTAQSLTSVSLVPPLVLVCPAKTSSTWPRIKQAGAFCANVLGQDQEAVCRAFATSGGDKFQGVGWAPTGATGSPLLHDVLAWVDCRILAEHDAGDHVIVVGRVVDLGVRPDGSPLLFYRGGFGRFQP
jgi:3-hydroxy-9,10-secoandrosta-1,3,5(10)-triene-9,17-dione monooxygenase reductase component